MKQKLRFKHFRNIGYRSTHGWYVSIGIKPKRAISQSL